LHPPNAYSIVSSAISDLICCSGIASAFNLNSKVLFERSSIAVVRLLPRSKLVSKAVGGVTSMTAFASALFNSPTGDISELDNRVPVKTSLIDS
jgi:hypothetical protein